MPFWTYMLRCADGKYYTGHTDDLDARIGAHQSGMVEGYTSTRLPVEFVWSEEFPDRDSAFDAERRIKGWSRAKKEALIAGDWERVSVLAKRKAAILRDAGEASTSSASPAPQDERSGINSYSPTAYAEERLAKRKAPVLGDAEEPSTSSSSPAPQDERNLKTTAHAEEGLSKADRPHRRPVSKHAAQAPLVILVNPQLGENIGKAARAMLNFGLTEMRLVAPRDGWPNPAAGPAASGADIVLANAELFDSVADAVADCTLVYATTVRKRGVTKPVVTPAEAAAEIVAAPGRSAILFGPERSGLETDHVALARNILTVPINPQFSSLNLAQAVILCAYEYSKVADGTMASPPTTDLDPPAPQGELDGMIGQLFDMLDARDYFFPEIRRTATQRTLVNLLTKPGWNHLEVRTLRGVLSTLEKRQRRED